MADLFTRSGGTTLRHGQQVRLVKQIGVGTRLLAAGTVGKITNINGPIVDVKIADLTVILSTRDIEADKVDP